MKSSEAPSHKEWVPSLGISYSKPCSILSVEAIAVISKVSEESLCMCITVACFRESEKPHESLSGTTSGKRLPSGSLWHTQYLQIRVPHQITVGPVFVKSWLWCVGTEGCFFIFFYCLRGSILPLPLYMRSWQLCTSCLFKEGICLQSLVMFPFDPKEIKIQCAKVRGYDCNRNCRKY